MHYKIAVLILCGFAVGCSSSSKQLATAQAEKEQLLATIRTQRETTRSLNQQVASLETRLDQAEKELARGGSPTRFSSLPNRPTEKPPATKSTPVKTDSLPWRSPTSKPEPLPTTPKDATRASSPSARDSLVALSKRDSRIHYDPSSGAAAIDAPVEFENQSATLSAEGKRQLDTLAKLLRSDEARDLKIVVAGAHTDQNGTARAQAVAEYLDRHGIPDDRLAVGSSGKRSVTSDSSASGVQVFLIDPDTSVARFGAKPMRR
jgi:outer membrane protein OmpA-like peptidoglycan-associated protein